MSAKTESDVQDNNIQNHLDWSDKQRRILTGGDRAEEFYTAERGFAFQPSELPHYHLLQGAAGTHDVFQEWRHAMFTNSKAAAQAAAAAGVKRKAPDDDAGADDEETEDAPTQPQPQLVPLVGAWTRLIFFGGWEHTSLQDERTFNLQTNNLFIDLRIPRSREGVLGKHNVACSLQDLTTKEQLRLYARQHVFAGYTQVCKVSTIPQHRDDLLCTRHHCIDWNFVGTGRSRPNKWWAELCPPEQSSTTAAEESNNQLAPVVKTWKEWAFPTDERGQHYYCEQWERLPGGDQTRILALRTAKVNQRQKQQPQPQRDGIILVIGDHFNYIRARDVSSLSKETQTLYTDIHTSLIGLVEAALEQDDLATARAYLSVQGGHGRVSQGWMIDCAIEPWKEGTALWTATDKPTTIVKNSKNNPSALEDCQFVWNDEVWEVFDTTLTSVEEISKLINDNVKS